MSKKKLTITKTKTVQGPATNISRNARNFLLRKGFIENLREHQEIESNFFGFFHSCYMYLLLETYIMWPLLDDCFHIHLPLFEIKRQLQNHPKWIPELQDVHKISLWPPTGWEEMALKSQHPQQPTLHQRTQLDWSSSLTKVFWLWQRSWGKIIM